MFSGEVPRINYICSDASTVGSTQGCVRKDADTSNTAALKVLWSSLYLFVVPNLFLCTDAANDYTTIVLYLCGVISRNFLLIPVCMSNMHHLSQFPECLAAVTLEIPLVMSRMPLVKMSRR